MIDPTEVVLLDLASIDLDDTAFMFRAALRLAGLAASIVAEGQQIPIVVRPSPRAQGCYQIISGFRRATAMRLLGLETIAAIVRRDLDDDELAFRAAVIENEQRQTYSDIDRALALLRYEQAGWSAVDVTALMGLKRTQRFNLKRLLTLPPPVQQAIDDPDDHFSATHGLELNRLLHKHPSLDPVEWVRQVAEQHLSVAQMKRAIAAQVHATEPSPPPTIFDPAHTDRGRRIFRLRAMKIEPDKLPEEEKQQIVHQLEELLAALKR